MTAPAAKNPRLWLAMAVFVAWLSWLAAEAWTVANPVIVSRPQILLAPIVVAGRLSPNHQRLKVDQVWWGEPTLKDQDVPIRLDPQAPLPSAGLLYVPLAKPDNDHVYMVQPAPLGDKDHWSPVYPDRPEVRRQIQRLIDERRQREPQRDQP